MRNRLLLKTFAISVTTMALLTACEPENNASSTIKAEPSVAQLDKEIKVLKEVRVNLQLLQQDMLDDMDRFVRFKGAQLTHPAQSQEWVMMELLAERVLDAQIGVRSAEAMLSLASETDGAEEATNHLEQSKVYLTVLEAEAENLNEVMREQTVNHNLYLHMQRSLELIQKQIDDNSRRAGDVRIKKLLIPNS
jgi:hypothetical protein